MTEVLIEITEAEFYLEKEDCLMIQGIRIEDLGEETFFKENGVYYFKKILVGSDKFKELS